MGQIALVLLVAACGQNEETLAQSSDDSKRSLYVPPTTGGAGGVDVAGVAGVAGDVGGDPSASGTGGDPIASGGGAGNNGGGGSPAAGQAGNSAAGPGGTTGGFAGTTAGSSGSQGGSNSGGAGVGGATAGGSSTGGTTGGTSTGGTATGGSAGGGLGPGYHLLGAYWNGSQEVVDVLDPTTGLGSYVGTLGNLNYWYAQYKLNPVSGRLYVFGMNAAQESKLYSLDVQTGIPGAEIPIELNLILLDVTPDDLILAARWTGEVEQVVTLDPLSGNTTVVGQFGNLNRWPCFSVYNPTTHEVHAFGLDIDENYALYTLNVETHLDHQVALTMQDTGPMAGVRPTGEILYGVINQTLTAVQSIDPTTGEIVRLTPWRVVDGFPQFGGVSYDPGTDTLYEVQYTSPGALLYTYHLDSNEESQVAVGEDSIIASL